MSCGTASGVACHKGGFGQLISVVSPVFYTEVFKLSEIYSIEGNFRGRFTEMTRKAVSQSNSVYKMTVSKSVVLSANILKLRQKTSLSGQQSNPEETNRVLDVYTLRLAQSVFS